MTGGRMTKEVKIEIFSLMTSKAAAEQTLADLLNEGWVVVSATFNNNNNQLIVILQRGK
jgi:hypothetical protein